MTYSEEEIQKYLSILQNVNDGLNIMSPVKDEHIPPKLQKKFHVRIAAILIFSKMVVSVTVTNVFILLVVFLSRSYFQRSMLFQAEMYLQETISLSK